MHIKELIVDGFKSYANRTVISGWDAQFNAITGFNGTGKSNMLDAICFVLGISNLSQVRVSGLQELVYKAGQSRVSKASVTIVFDNSDRSRSPLGYESFNEITVTRQVVIGGRNKYLINGHTAQLARVQNLFHSVGLNVNNPQFLIMQGRITKVCNMKPVEVLGMIEEAAGTKMFECKKQAAERTIAKKQAKVDEIDRVMKEEIQPVLDQLRNEKQNFYKYNANRTQIEMLTKFVTAFNYWNGLKRQQSMKQQVEEADQSHEALLAQLDTANQSVELKTRDHAALVSKRDEQFAKNPRYLALEAEGNEKGKALVQSSAQWQHSKESLESEKKERTKMQKQRDTLAKNIASKKKEADGAEQKAKTASEEQRRIQEEIQQIKSAQLGIVVGGGGEGEGEGENAAQGGLAGQLMSLQKQLATEEGSLTSANNKLKHLTTTLKEQEKKLRECEKDGDGMGKEIQRKKAEVEKLQQLLSQTSFDATEKQRMESRIQTLQDELGNLQYEYDGLNARLGSRLKFDYNARAAGLDASKVKGLVANLIRIPDRQHSTAIEITAGSRLFNVVVDTEETGRALLEKGQLKKRVTIIPLNKINTRTIPSSVQAKADALAQQAGGSCKLALSVVGYDAEVSAAMSYIFGQSFVVSNAALASKITFHPEVRSKCITLDGDVYDPNGSMEGGSMPSGPTILMQLQQMAEKQEKIQSIQAELKSLNKKAELMQSNESKAIQTQKKLDVLQIELQSLQERQVQSELFALSSAVEATRVEIASLKELVSSASERRASLQKRIRDVENLMKNFEKERANQEKMFEKRLAALTKESHSTSKALQDLQKKARMLKIEVEELEEELKGMDAAISKHESDTMQPLEEQIRQLEKEVERKREEYDAFNETLSIEKSKCCELDASLQKIQKEINQLKKVASDVQLEVKKSTNARAHLAQELGDLTRHLTRQEKDHEFLLRDKQQFGVAGGDYDFTPDSNPERASSKLSALQSEQEKLSRRINKKVMGLFEKAEADYSDLEKKRTIILEDKEKIEHVIKELDVEKQRTLAATWKQVSDSFGTIFSTLLPGVSSRLELADPVKGVMEGLEMKVSFGGVEKESLSELSGGQRSLLALSLILALLKFKPAPMYILDEIDAALDLSHTQNIGQVLKKHFAQAQFIVVSLKEGMFNNANVLFRTKFVDGVSTVIRTTAKERKAGKA